MDEFKDMDKIVLQPGEVLLLRPKHNMPRDELLHMQKLLSAAKICAVLLAPDMEMMVGVNVVAPEEPEPEKDAKFREDIEAAYAYGRIIQYKVGDDWIDAHRHASPHVFDWDCYEYRLSAK